MLGALLWQAVPAYGASATGGGDPAALRWALAAVDRPGAGGIGAEVIRADLIRADLIRAGVMGTGATGIGANRERDRASERTDDDSRTAGGDTARHRAHRDPSPGRDTRDDGVPGDAPAWHQGPRTGGPGGAGGHRDGDVGRRSGAQGNRHWSEGHHDRGEDPGHRRDGGREGRDDRDPNRDDRYRDGAGRADRGGAGRTPRPPGSATHRDRGKPEAPRSPKPSAHANPPAPRTGRDRQGVGPAQREPGDSLRERNRLTGDRLTTDRPTEKGSTTRPNTDRPSDAEWEEGERSTGDSRRDVNAAGQGTDRVRVRSSTSGVLSFGAGLVLIGLGIGSFGVRLRRG